MYRISKVLNHNGVIVIDLNDQKEYVLLGKGAGFGRKIGERMEKPETCTDYSLQELLLKNIGWMKRENNGGARNTPSYIAFRIIIS